MISSWTRRAAMLALIVAANVVPSRQAAADPPTAEVAKRCLHYAYIVYPFKRPGAVRMSGDREAWFRDCLAKNGEVPQPTASGKPQASVSTTTPASRVSAGDFTPPAQTSH
jgi:hypothetical protein